jgi:hypothetical protein
MAQGLFISTGVAPPGMFFVTSAIKYINYTTTHDVY